MQKNLAEKISNSEYENLISKTIQTKDKKEKSIVKGKVIAIENDVVIIDVGLKSEGRVPLSEFSRPGQKHEIVIGEDLDVFVENVDSANGETKLSREKAVKQGAWNNLQDCFDNNKTVKGVPFNRVKGGMSVDLDGVTAFLPGSQIDTRQIIKDTKELLPPEAMVGNRIADACQKRGLLVRPLAHLNILSPPLVLQKAQIDWMVNILRISIEEVTDDLIREKLFS